MPNRQPFTPPANATTRDQVERAALEFYSARHNAELDADPKKPVNFASCQRAAVRAAKKWEAARNA